MIPHPFTPPACRLCAALLCLGLPALVAQAAGPSGLLNDTGQASCYDATDTAVVCGVAGVGTDAGDNPRQDGRLGRDARNAAGTLVKTGGGVAGFDFTALDSTGAAVAPGAHDCVHDNVTNLVWSTEILFGGAWTTAAATAAGYSRCGLGSNWRLPTRRELISIVHHGASSPATDPTYFPGTLNDAFWSSDELASDTTNAWFVGFFNGSANAHPKANTHRLRLVHDGP